MWSDKTDLMLRSELASDDGASLIAYRRDAVNALKTTVADVLSSLKFNLSEFVNTSPTLSGAITNMLTAANGAGRALYTDA